MLCSSLCSHSAAGSAAALALDPAIAVQFILQSHHSSVKLCVHTELGCEGRAMNTELGCEGRAMNTELTVKAEL